MDWCILLVLLHLTLLFASLFFNFWATVYKTVRPMLSVHCLSVYLSVCDVGVLWPNGWIDQDETWHAGRSRRWPHCVRWGPTCSSPKAAQPPIFGLYLLRPNGYMDQDATWHGARLGPGDFVLDGDPAPLPKRHTDAHDRNTFCVIYDSRKM